MPKVGSRGMVIRKPAQKLGGSFSTRDGSTSKLLNFSPENSPWVEGTAKLTIDGKIVKRESTPEFPVKIYGPFCVHRSVNQKEEPGYVLLYIPLSILVTWMPEEQHCLTIGEFLASQFVLAFRGDNKNRILSKLPKWVSGWVKNCRHRQSVLAPEPFMNDITLQDPCVELEEQDDEDSD